MRYLLCVIFSVFYLQTLSAQIPPSVTFDPATGNYIIQYQGFQGNIFQVIFEPATKIEPEVVPTVTREDSVTFRYNYIVSNGVNSQQRLLRFTVSLFTSVENITRPNREWRIGEYSFFPALKWSHVMRDPSGISTPFDGIAPDSSASGFSYESSGLPAIVTSYFRGTTLSPAFPEEPPEEVIAFLKPLRKFPGDTVQGKTIGPADPPSPFDASTFLDTLISYTSQSLALGWISDQVTADKYEGHFSTAKTELQQADTTAARSELQTVLQEVAQDTGSVLTSEAYALLRFNTEYLLDQLPTAPFSIFSVFATHSIWLKQNSAILSGSVAVNDSGAPPFLASNVELVVGQGASTPSGTELKAHGIRVKQGAAVNSDVFYNQLTNNGAITGALNTPLSLPLFTTLPPFQSAPAGSQDITVAQNDSISLAPGDYGDIKVKKKGIILFTGGIYNIRSIDFGNNTKMLFGGPSEVRVEEKFETGQKAYVGPQDTTAMSAKDIVFYVAGMNGNNGNLGGATPRAAKLGLNSTVFANFYVSNGTLWLRQNSASEGSFIGKDVIVGIGAKVTLNSAF